MRPRTPTLLFALGLTTASLLPAQGLVGSWRSAQPPMTLEVRADGSLTFQGQVFRYQTEGGSIAVQGPQGQGLYQYQVQGDTLILAGGDIGYATLQRVAGTPAAPRTASPPNPGSPVMPDQSPAAPPPPTPASQTAPLAAGGKLFEAPPYGFRMNVEPQWVWQFGEDVVQFGHPQVTGRLVLAPLFEALSPQTIEKVSKEGYRNGQGFDLEPKTPGLYQEVPTGMGRGYYLRVQGTAQGTPVTGFLGAFLPPSGLPVVALAIAAPGKEGPLEKAARRMLDSVRLFHPRSPVLDRWRQELTGKKVEYLYSHSSVSPGGPSGFASANKEWHLCPSGQYWYRGSSHTSFDSGNDFSANPGAGAWVTGSSAGKGNERGTWSLVPEGEGAAILLHPQGGEPRRYSLTRKKKFASSYMQKYMGSWKIFASDPAQCY